MSVAVTLSPCFQVAHDAVSCGMQLAAWNLGNAQPLNQQVPGVQQRPSVGLEDRDQVQSTLLWSLHT